MQTELTFSFEHTDSNPNMSEDMDHWRVTIHTPADSMTLVYSKGYGHGGAEPTLEEVLDTLASDACSIQAEQGSATISFEEWCSELGFDPDSRKAERSFKATEAQTFELWRLLGTQDFNELVYETERL